MGWLWGQCRIRLPICQGVCGRQGEGEELCQRIGGAGPHTDELTEQRGRTQGKIAGIPVPFLLEETCFNSDNCAALRKTPIRLNNLFEPKIYYRIQLPTGNLGWILEGGGMNFVNGKELSKAVMPL